MQLYSSGTAAQKLDTAASATWKQADKPRHA
jgi:hypothetical protein